MWWDLKFSPWLGTWGQEQWWQLQLWHWHRLLQADCKTQTQRPVLKEIIQNYTIQNNIGQVHQFAMYDLTRNSLNADIMYQGNDNDFTSEV